jgi:hypothetical protein
MRCLPTVCVFQSWSAADPVPIVETRLQAPLPAISGFSEGGDGIGVLPTFEKLETKKSKRRGKGKRTQPAAGTTKDELDDDVDVVRTASGSAAPTAVHHPLKCVARSLCQPSSRPHLPCRLICTGSAVARVIWMTAAVTHRFLTSSLMRMRAV